MEAGRALQWGLGGEFEFYDLTQGSYHVVAGVTEQV